MSPFVALVLIPPVAGLATGAYLLVRLALWARDATDHVLGGER